jgi:tetratricopeptide (TPR) repeat protein
MTIAGLGYAYAMTGRLANALPWLEQAVERARRVDRRRETQWLAYLSEAYLLDGRLEAALHLAERALVLTRERRERGNQAYALRLLSDIAVQREPPEVEPAEAYYRQALALTDELGMRPLRAHCHRGLGLLYAKIGRRDEARADLSTAIDLYRAMDMTFWLPQAETTLVEAEG